MTPVTRALAGGVCSEAHLTEGCVQAGWLHVHECQGLPSSILLLALLAEVGDGLHLLLLSIKLRLQAHSMSGEAPLCQSGCMKSRKRTESGGWTRDGRALRCACSKKTAQMRQGCHHTYRSSAPQALELAASMHLVEVL